VLEEHKFKAIISDLRRFASFKSCMKKIGLSIFSGNYCFYKVIKWNEKNVVFESCTARG
jgi:hypothetical protein